MEIWKCGHLLRYKPNRTMLMQFHLVIPQPMLNQRVWLSITFFILTTAGYAQTLPPNREEMVFVVVEQSPEFPGGFKTLMEFMRKNVRYPSEAEKAGVKGNVFASFVVEPDGRLTNIQLLKGIGYGCDEEAIRVIEAMPCWIAGTQSGRPLRVKYNLPVLFGIDHPVDKLR